MEKQLAELKTRLAEISALGGAQAVLGWDQSTHMPPGGAPARGFQLSVLAQLAQEKAIDPALGKLLDNLQEYAESLPFDSDDASLVRVARRDYERAIRVPPEFVARLSVLQAESYQAWTEARPANDFAKVRPYLEKMVELCRELADFFPGYEHIADPLIENADFGMKASSVRSLFASLRAQQVPILKAITSQAEADDSCLHRSFAEDGQIAFGRKVVERLGFDFKRGRQDKSPHPFTTSFSSGDVRITTRVNEHDLGDCLFSMIHEAGHAMYEQGVNPQYDGTPLANGTSAGVHESQSRLWENIVGRSRNFWEFFYPDLQQTFPTLKDVPLDAFLQAINAVKPSLVRTDADEVTYNLHVMLRFDFELAMLEGSLAVKDLPQAWQARFMEDFGMSAPDDRDGCLQDMHWYGGLVGGMFQGYTLGNVMGAQFYEAALKAHPQIPDEIRQGKFDTLLGWLRENIYRHGRKYTAPELVKKVTGSDVTIEPYLHYLRSKYAQYYHF